MTIKDRKYTYMTERNNKIAKENFHKNKAIRNYVLKSIGEENNGEIKRLDISKEDGRDISVVLQIDNHRPIFLSFYRSTFMSDGYYEWYAHNMVRVKTFWQTYYFENLMEALIFAEIKHT